MSKIQTVAFSHGAWRMARGQAETYGRCEQVGSKDESTPPLPHIDVADCTRHLIK